MPTLQTHSYANLYKFRGALPKINTPAGQHGGHEQVSLCENPFVEESLASVGMKVTSSSPGMASCEWVCLGILSQEEDDVTGCCQD